jgi:ferredoxin-NADP reductase
MASSAAPATHQGAVRDHGFHPLRVRHVVRETAEASSFVLDVPPELRDAFAYEAGQFLTFRVRLGGEAHHRCYSMSSAPAVDGELQVTVKRVPGGLVSNWMIDTLAPGDTVEASVPAGVFLLKPGAGDIVAFSGGSGITPVFSLLKTALATTSRRVRLYYANRDRDAVIFGGDLDALASRYPDRLEVVHHLDVERGFVDAGALGPFVRSAAGSDCYVCGPGPFMDIVEVALRAQGVPADRIHIERFTPAVPAPVPEAADAPDPSPTAARVTVELDGRTETVDHHPGTTVLQAARQMGMSPPYSCESGTCATCMARLVEGSVTMHANDVLTDDEVADGWVLTCQSVPSSSAVHVVYEGS